MNNYVHFRPPMNKERVELNRRNDGIYNNDFLDNASEDLPQGVWTVITPQSKRVALLRSKLWPGFYSFH